jgi:putative endonuclease
MLILNQQIMLSSKQISGIKGEAIAAEFLKKKGYKILERNFRAKTGEIDLIALDSDTLVFVEVKARHTHEFGTPLDAITQWKLNSLIKTAQLYKIKNPKLPENLRIDAVAITLDARSAVKSIELVKNISL